MPPSSIACRWRAPDFERRDHVVQHLYRKADHEPLGRRRRRPRDLRCAAANVVDSDTATPGRSPAIGALRVAACSPLCVPTTSRAAARPTRRARAGEQHSRSGGSGSGMTSSVRRRRPRSSASRRCASEPRCAQRPPPAAPRSRECRELSSARSRNRSARCAIGPFRHGVQRRSAGPKLYVNLSLSALWACTRPSSVRKRNSSRSGVPQVVGVNYPAPRAARPQSCRRAVTSRNLPAAQRPRCP